MFRYVALIWDAASPPQAEVATRLSARLLSASPDWKQVCRTVGLSVFCIDDRVGASTYCPLANEGGVVVGTLFRRAEKHCDISPGATRAISALNAPETYRILATRGQHLITSYWGRYVAFLSDSQTSTLFVVKDPFGRLPCFNTKIESVSVFFSSLSDCLRLVLRTFTLNWAYIRRRVAVSTCGYRETALNEISQVCGGDRLDIRNGTQSRTLLWQPTSIADSASLEDPTRISEEMRATAAVCTSAWLSGHGHALHRLSGGLDSSIVLACMSHADSSCRITCVTYFRPGGNSDERPWAHLATQRADCEHVEHAREPHLNFEQLSRMVPLPHPPDDLAFLELSDYEHDLAEQKHATAIFSGEGGDAVLGSYSARFAASDFFRHRGFDHALFNIGMRVAMTFDASVWRVLMDAVRRRHDRPNQEDLTLLRDARLLVNKDVFASAATEVSQHRHPWLYSENTTAARFETLGFCQLNDPYYEPTRSPDKCGAEPIFPLLSQPFVELCLRIPSYMHFQSGQDRGLARQAFSSWVPAKILSRRWKDRAQGFTEEILFHSRAFARELLLDGLLVKEKLLDARAVEFALSGLRAKNSVSVGEILDHIVTEAWLRTWCGSQLSPSIAIPSLTV
jgi:asparagine synthase (glutamine-hydrolysing)